MSKPSLAVPNVQHDFLGKAIEVALSDRIELFLDPNVKWVVGTTPKASDEISLHRGRPCKTKVYQWEYLGLTYKAENFLIQLCLKQLGEDPNTPLDYYEKDILLSNLNDSFTSRQDLIDFLVYALVSCARIEQKD